MDNSNHKKFLTARSNLYLLISALFSDPVCKRFSLLYDREFRVKLMESALLYEGELNVEIIPQLVESLRSLFTLLDGHRQDIEDEYIRIFGHTLSKNTAPYEMEQKEEDVFSKTQKLSDLNAFYHAFGLELHGKERQDHLSVEAEFISFLLLKEVIAIENNLGEEVLETCERALCSFWYDHFNSWIQRFILTMEKQNSILYSSIIAWFKTFYQNEKKFFPFFVNKSPSTFAVSK